MHWRDALLRLRALLFRREMDEELSEELQFHLQMQAARNLARNVDPAEARRQARLQFGSIERAAEECREARGLSVLENLFQDLRYAFRILKKSPVFTAVAVLTLGFGIGLNTTLFSVVDAVAMKPIPVRDSGRIVRLERWFASDAHGDIQYVFSHAEYRFFSEHNKVFSTLIEASFPRQIAVSLPLDAAAARVSKELLGPPEQAVAQMVSANYFSDLGVMPIMGRIFRQDEGKIPGADPLVVLSYPYWQRRFDGDPSIVGKVVKINDTAFTVIGVTSRRFVGTGNPPVLVDVWTPVSMQAQIVPGQDWLNQPLDYRFQVLAYLSPGASMKEAQTDISVLEQRFAHDHPVSDETALPARDGLVRNTTAVTVQSATFFGNTEDIRFKAIVVLLMTIVGLVLVVACANLANMLLAKASGRQNEIGVRLALGASRERLVRQLLTESVLLAIIGGAVAILFSLWGSRLLWLAAEQFAGMHSAFVKQISPDARVLAYTLLVSLGTGVLFGLSPALRSSRLDLTNSLKDSGTPFGQRLDRSHLRGLLVGGQIAISTLFLIVAGLLTHGLIRSTTIDPGFEVRRLYPMALPYSNDAARNRSLREQALDRIALMPEVENITYTDFVPLRSTWTTQVSILSDQHGAAASASSNTLDTCARHVSFSYFDTLGIPLLRGRNFTRDDSRSGTAVAVVSAALARQAWGSDDPLGRKIKLQTGRHEWSTFEVVGIVGDVRSANISRLDPAFVYLPTSTAHLNDYFGLVRISGDARKAIAAIRTTLEQTDGQLRPGFSMVSLQDDAVQSQIVMAKTFTLSAMFLAVVALLLASIGVYGVMAFLVSQREREVGIHMALGATRSDVLALMLRQGMRPVIFGVMFGVLGALGVSGLLRAILIFPGSVDVLYGASWFDPASFIGLASLLAAVALLACYLPARRATCVEPMIALRHE
ncbi:MAG TPA: ABC transporter permease [Terriglobales bacterium]|nr:ABC transporter permease [Terriglobales bacterium]